MKHYTIYQITNTVNGKIYVGCHKTSDLNDGYMGSGVMIKKAFNKYGKENFVKEYLHIFGNTEDMLEMESTIVNKEFVDNSNTYNLVEGGKGGWDRVDHKKGRAVANANGALEKATAALKELFTDEEWIKQKSITWKHTMKEKYGGFHICASFKNKHHTEETKRSIGAKNSIHQSGTGNSQYGSMWITNGTKSKKILKTDAIPNGWCKGRKMRAQLRGRAPGFQPGCRDFEILRPLQSVQLFPRYRVGGKTAGLCDSDYLLGSYAQSQHAQGPTVKQKKGIDRIEIAHKSRKRVEQIQKKLTQWAFFVGNG